MIDDVVALFRAKDHRNYMSTEEFFALFNAGFLPALALSHNLAHADGDLGWT